MSTVDHVSEARRRLAQVETAEDATDLVDDLERVRAVCRIIDAAPGEINEITLLKVETRAKRADLIDAGQANGIFRKDGRPAKTVHSAGQFPVPRQRIDEDRVLRDELDEMRRQIAAATSEITDRQLLELARRRRAQCTDRAARAIQPAIDDYVAEAWTLLAGPMQDRMADIDAATVDIIVTDPPYPTESLPLWSDLAEHAARVLVPGGIVIALSGKIMLPDVIRRLGEHLHYGWVYCQPLPGDSSRILARHVGQEWKPWLAYSNGPWPSGRVGWHGDMLHGVPKMKEQYHWQQAEQPAGELIVRLSPLNGVVLDPFCGVGTYGRAAVAAGRQFIGIDADASRLTTAASQLAAL